MVKREKTEEKGEGKVVVKAKYRAAERAQVFLGIVIVLAVVLVGAAGWFWWKSNQVVSENSEVAVNEEAPEVGEEPSEARKDASVMALGPLAKWSTHTSEELGVTFKYPESFYVGQVGENGELQVIMVSDKEEDVSGEADDFLGPIQMQLIEGKSMDEMVIEGQQIYEGLSARQERLTGELGGVYLTGETEPGVVAGELVQVFMPWGEKLLGIVFVDRGDDVINEKIFREIVKTIERN